METLQTDNNDEFPEPAQPASPRPTGSSRFIVRCILFGILIIGVVVLLIDRKARSDCQNFHDALMKAMDGNQIMNNVEVQKLAGRKPVKVNEGKAAQKRYYETYEWRGGFHTYTVYCGYQVAADKLLNAVSLNQPLD